MEWSEQFYAWRAGEDCPSCAEGRPAATRFGVRYFEGDCCDAYLVRADIQRGLTFAVFRGRHVVEPTELGDDEAASPTSFLATPTTPGPAGPSRSPIPTRRRCRTTASQRTSPSCAAR